MRRVAIAGLATLVVIVGGALPAVAGTVRATTGPATTGPATTGPATTGPDAPAVSAMSPPLPSAISCGSVRSCLAVGNDSALYNGSSVITAKPLAWNGSRWKTLTMPVPKGAVAVGLAAVSCESATFCLAVGNTIPNATTDNTGLYAVTWNGTALKMTATPPLPVPSSYSQASFGAVSCLTARDCVALGAASDAAGNSIDFAATWNGAKWTLRLIAQPKDTQLDLDGISCVSATSCVLVGASSEGTSSSLTSYAGTWNGTSLTAQKVPLPAKAGFTGLTGVSCVSKSRCAAAGFGLTNLISSAGFGFTEVWNGKAWTTAKAPAPKADTLVMLNGLSCATGANCVAVGLAGTSASSGAEALSYNGKTWARMAVPGPAKGNSDEFDGVSCPKAGDCVAIGDGGTADGPASSLAGYWNGKSWKVAAA